MIDWLIDWLKLISPNIYCNNVIQKIIEALSICLVDSKKTKDGMAHATGVHG